MRYRASQIMDMARQAQYTCRLTALAPGTELVPVPYEHRTHAGCGLTATSGSDGDERLMLMPALTWHDAEYALLHPRRLVGGGGPVDRHP